MKRPDFLTVQARSPFCCRPWKPKSVSGRFTAGCPWGVLCRCRRNWEDSSEPPSTRLRHRAAVEGMRALDPPAASWFCCTIRCDAEGTSF